jgi:hypothetical protein
MNVNMKLKPITTLFAIALLAISILTTGCGEEDCSLTTLSVARFDFRDSQTNGAVKLSQGATITGIATIDGIQQVDTLFNQAQSYMSVPLSYTDKTIYVMHYTELMRDTIVISHRNIPFVSTIECGAVMHFEVQDLSYTTNALDSVTLVNPRITNEETTNFNIYYRTTDTE